MLSNLLNLCRCSKIHLSTTPTRLLIQRPSTLPVATKMGSQLLQGTAAVQAGTSTFATIAGHRKLAMHESRRSHIFLERSIIVLGTVVVLPQLHL